MRRVSLFLAIILLVSCLGCAQTGIAFAAEADNYTGVLEDLQKDETFDVAQFPASDKDSMDVIQIAESSAGELFLYVYSTLQDKFTATEARISVTVGDNLSPKDYKLTLLSRDGTLSKYVVEGLAVKSDAVRYYVVIQLARPWNKDYDKGTDGNNTTDTVVYGVQKSFTSCTVDGEVSYTESHEDCVDIQSKYVGNLRYLDTLSFFLMEYTSSHYVAFSTSIAIEKIYEADVFYVIKNYENVPEIDFGKNPPEIFLKSTNNKSVTLKSEEYGNNTSNWTALQHTWKRIQSVEDFYSSEKLSADVIQSLKDKQWVLRFDETEIREKRSGLPLNINMYDYSEVSEVSILRLYFLSNGKTYNLGVVDNKQTGGSVSEPDNNPDNPMEPVLDFWQRVEDFFKRVGNWLSTYWWIVAAILAIVVLGILSAIFKPVAKVVWWILKIIFYIVTLPVWIVIWIVRAAKKKKD